MCGAGRFEVHVMNPCLGQRIAEVFCRGTFGGTDPEKEHFYLLVERRGIGERTVAAGLRIERTARAPGPLQLSLNPPREANLSRLLSTVVKACAPPPWTDPPWRDFPGLARLCPVFLSIVGIKSVIIISL